MAPIDPELARRFLPPGTIPSPTPAAAPQPAGGNVFLGQGQQAPVMDQGAAVLEQPDGGAVVDLNPYEHRAGGERKSDRFDRNLAEEMDDAKLAMLANDLLIGIENDEQSRKDALSMLSQGLRLLGLIIEDGRTDVDSSAPLEGMSTVRHPLLLEACLLFQANARGELLPAAGPVKIRDDRPTPPNAPANVPPVPPQPQQQGEGGMGSVAPPSPQGAAPMPPGGGAPHPSPSPFMSGVTASPMPGQGVGGSAVSPPIPAAGSPTPPVPPPNPMLGHNGGPAMLPEETRDDIAIHCSSSSLQFLCTFRTYRVSLSIVTRYGNGSFLPLNFFGANSSRSYSQ
jgi:hypothetical protein